MAVVEIKASFDSAARLSDDDPFADGDLEVKPITLKKNSSFSPPTELYIVAPTSQGLYPVLLFFHGTCCKNTWYSDILQHVSSHGFIVVAPQFNCCLPMLCCGPCATEEIDLANDVAKWMSEDLHSVLKQEIQPADVRPDLGNVALSGHSRGGKTAFVLVTAASQVIEFKAVLGLDPVAGMSPSCRPSPKLLSYIPRSFNNSIPVAVIGSGLGSKSHMMMPPFAPDGCNHAEFFNESKPPSYYFLAKDYGHCDVLDEGMANLARLICSSGKDSGKLRRAVGGILVAFLEAYLKGKGDDLKAIMENPDKCGIALDPVIYIAN